MYTCWKHVNFTRRSWSDGGCYITCSVMWLQRTQTQFVISVRKSGGTWRGLVIAWVRVECIWESGIEEVWDGHVKISQLNFVSLHVKLRDYPGSPPLVLSLCIHFSFPLGLQFLRAGFRSDLFRQESHNELFCASMGVISAVQGTKQTQSLLWGT